jgi:hypothetical protein
METNNNAPPPKLCDACYFEGPGSSFYYRHTCGRPNEWHDRLEELRRKPAAKQLAA